MPRRLSQGEYVWNAKIIPRLLDLFDEHDLKTTFFVVGINAKNHPDMMQEIVFMGHEIATHGWMHEDIVGIGREEEERRLLMSVDAIESVTGVSPVGNRISGGEIGAHSHDILAKNSFIYDSIMRGSDLPYKLENGLVIVHSYYEMDDFHLFADYPGYVAYYARMMSPEVRWEIRTNAFDGYYRCASATPRCSIPRSSVSQGT